MQNPIHQRAIAYISNAGGSPEVSWFDEDHEPIGPQLRDDLLRMGMVRECDDGITGKRRIELTDAGRAELPPRHGTI